jgi:hypothetical protein
MADKIWHPICKLWYRICKDMKIMSLKAVIIICCNELSIWLNGLKLLIAREKKGKRESKWIIWLQNLGLTLWTLIPSFPGQTKNGYNLESRNTGTSASNTSLIQHKRYSIVGHTLHLPSEGDCLEQFNKTGFRDNLGLFSGIFHNFFSDEAYHFLKLFEGCLFQLYHTCPNPQEVDAAYRWV